MRDAITHIAVGGRALCRPSSFTATANSAECRQCNDKLDRLLDMLLRAVVTGRPGDRQKARTAAEKMGFDTGAYDC